MCRVRAVHYRNSSGKTRRVLLWELKMDNRSTVAAESKQNFWRCVATGAAILASLFVICWIGTMVSNLRLSHMFIQLFTTAPVDSGVALLEGVCSSLVFGAITGRPVRTLLQLVQFRQALGYLNALSNPPRACGRGFPRSLSAPLESEDAFPGVRYWRLMMLYVQANTNPAMKPTMDRPITP